jgi:hypothetical protein
MYEINVVKCLIAFTWIVILSGIFVTLFRPKIDRGVVIGSASVAAVIGSLVAITFVVFHH